MLQHVRFLDFLRLNDIVCLEGIWPFLMNLLFTTAGNVQTLESQERVAVWQSRKHIVELMLAYRVCWLMPPNWCANPSSEASGAIPPRTALETVLSVERCGLSINGVHQDGTAADDLRTGVRTLQAIFQESRSEALSLLSFVHCQASKRNDRDRFSS
jgi:hypothetical protein